MRGFADNTGAWAGVEMSLWILRITTGGIHDLCCGVYPDVSSALFVKSFCFTLFC